MPQTTRRRLEVVQDYQAMYAKVEEELSEGYLEVEITGMSARRLFTAYRVLLRQAWAHTLGSVRSLVRPTPAH